jgi:hypothetical protein
MILSEARGKRILYDDGAKHMFASVTGISEHPGSLKHRTALLTTAAGLWVVMLFPDCGLSPRSALLVPISRLPAKPAATGRFVLTSSKK